MKSLLAAASLFAALAPAARAEEESLEQVTVTATRFEEDLGFVPADISVVSGDELRARNAVDLRSALALVPGVDVGPGSDQGPAGGNPELWGLREIDAYLLVVDGVPWGGAFNPDPATVDLHDVDRIEILRGAAPVMYGATSFTAVISVIHKDPKRLERSMSGSAGSYGSGEASVSVPLASSGPFTHALQLDAGRRGLAGLRAGYQHAHANWRGRWDLPGGTLTLGVDGVMLRQSPNSPMPRTTTTLGTFTGLPVPLDANHNPLDAYLNENRATVNVGYDRPTAGGMWSSLISFSNSDVGTLRGFLSASEAAPFDAHGFREHTNTLNVYVDSHFAFTRTENWKAVAGADYALGRGVAHGGDFDYTAPLDGINAPGGAGLPPQADIRIKDQRDFTGLYGFGEWTPLPRWLLEAGVRLNHAAEGLQSTTQAFPGGPGTFTSGGDRKDLWRAGGGGGVTFTAWSRGKDFLRLYGDYRNTFKPAATDFGLDTIPQVLSPETAQSYEAGAKSRWWDDRVDADLAVFQMDMKNVALNTQIGGVPTLVSGGVQRLRGFEASAGWRVGPDLRWLATYSLHDARFRNLLANDDGGAVVQVGGKRVVSSARNMASTGFMLSPGRGWIGSLQANYVGSRYLDKTNTALAPAYATWTAGAGWRQDGWELRLDGYNVNNQRPPVSASEFGDSQYYLLPARFIQLSTNWKF